MRSLGLALLAVLVSAAPFAHGAGGGIAGDYRIHGQNPDGSSYQGTLHIEQNGEVYSVSWDSAHGAGVLAGNQLVVSYGDAACGVVAYRREGAGTLEGVWAMSNSSVTGSETATPSASGGTSLAGDYIVDGKNIDKSPYKGALFISQDEETRKFLFGWRTGHDARGFGFTHEGVIAVAFGAPSCGLVAYTLGADGTLDGRWSMLHGGFGSEQAKRTD